MNKLSFPFCTLFFNVLEYQTFFKVGNNRKISAENARNIIPRVKTTTIAGVIEPESYFPEP